jgi:phosphate transport system permease protein
MSPRTERVPPRSLRFAEEPSRINVDRLFGALGAASAALVAAVLIAVAFAVIDLAGPSLRTFGASFAVGSTWRPMRGTFGALPFVYGTAVTASIALCLAVPVALGVALFLTDLGAPSLRRPVRALVELLAAIPSVVYGLWAAHVLAPLLRTTFEPALEAHVGGPLFSGPKPGFGLLCGALVLAVMILPTIASVAREVLAAVPSELREGGLALGATRWDVVRRIVIPHARSGIFGAVLLGLGRAVGETMAMAAVVGSRPEVSSSLFAPGYTMASVVANEFPVATDELHVAALAEIGLLLFVVTLVFNIAARLLVARVRGAVVQ